MADLLLISVLSGPLLYLLAIVAFPNPKTSEEYHYAARKLPPEDFVDTTIMYALQVAAISLFATWGYLHGLYSLLVPFFWGLGYIIISFLLWQGKLDSLIYSDSFKTIHQFIGGNKYSAVGKVAAVITLLSISGPAMFEAFFTSAVIKNSQIIIGNSSMNAESLAIIFLVMSTIYMLRGGFTGAVRLDKIQLASGYVLFVAFVSVLLMSLNISLNSSSDSAIVCILSILLFLTAITIFIFRISLGRSTHRADAYGLGCTFVASLLPLYPAVNSFSIGSLLSINKIDLSNFFFPSSFTVPALVSLFIANVFYQLVDVGNWQRILAVDVNLDGVDDVERKSKYKSLLSASLNNIAISSPLTWIVAILLGLCVRLIERSTHSEDVFQSILSFILSPSNPMAQPLMILLITSLVAIMFSTIDALVSATSFTVTNDIFEKNDEAELDVHRTITVGVIVVQLLFYLFISFAAKDSAASVLYLCWSFQIAFAPAILSTLFNVRHNQSELLSSILGGCISAFLPLYLLGPNSVYEWSPLLALLGASIFLFFTKYLQHLFRYTIGLR